MKAKFLKRIEREKSRKIKILLECDENEAPQTFKLVKHEIYEIKGIAPKKITGVDKQVSPGDTCGSCVSWKRVKMKPDGFEVPQGECSNQNSGMEITPIYHWCSHWTKEDKK